MSDRYIAAAYVVFLLAVLVYVALIALKLARLEREVDGLERRVREPAEQAVEEDERVAVG